jgi:hypothetical protein
LEGAGFEEKIILTQILKRESSDGINLINLAQDSEKKVAVAKTATRM